MWLVFNNIAQRDEILMVHVGDSDTDVTRRSYTLVSQPSSIGLTRTDTYSQLWSENAAHLNDPKAYYESVLEGQEGIDINIAPELSSAVSIAPCDKEQFEFDGFGAQQDSDEIDHDGDMDSLDSSRQPYTSQQSVNEECVPVGEVNCTSVEAVHQEDDDAIVTGSPEQCQETDNDISQRSVCVIPQKTSKQVTSYNIDRPLPLFIQHLLLRSIHQ